jgi:hypothetical protein
MLKNEYIEDLAKSLNLCNYQIAELTRVKEEMEKRLCATLDHGDEGQKTYVSGGYKITMTTGWNYTLDKEEYKIMKSRIPAGLDPVVERMAYDIEKRVIKQNWPYASGEEQKLLESVIKINPKKLNVKSMMGV